MVGKGIIQVVILLSVYIMLYLISGIIVIGRK